MPYITQKEREALVDGELNVNITSPEVMNYLYSQAILRLWNFNPSYGTIHALKLATDDDPGRFLDLSLVEAKLTDFGTLEKDRKAARQLAFMEFYRRIGAAYEFEKIQTNGDLAEYEEALKHLNSLSRERFNKAIEEKK